MSEPFGKSTEKIQKEIEVKQFKMAYKCIDNNTELLHAVADYFTHFKLADVYGPVIGKWCVSKVTDFSNAFKDRTTFNSHLSHWNTSNAVDMSYMFYNTSFNRPLPEFEVNNVLNFDYMFAYSPFDQDISGWNVASAASMTGMFMNAFFFSQDLCPWGNVLNNPITTNMFVGTQCPWPTSPLMLVDPPGPFCYNCDQFFIIQVVGTGLDNNLSQTLRPYVESVVLAQFGNDFGPYDLIAPGTNVTFKNRRLITIRTCPNNCGSGNVQCLVSWCATKSRGTHRRLQSQCQASSYDPSITQHTMNEELLPFEDKCGVKLHAICKPYNVLPGYTEASPTISPLPNVTVSSCPGLGPLNTYAPTRSLAPALAPCLGAYQPPTISPATAQTEIQTCLTQTSNKCLCTANAAKCAETQINLCQVASGKIGKKEKKSVKKKFMKLNRKNCG